MADCKFASEISFSFLDDGSMARELNIDNDRFHERYNLIFDFLKAGGKGKIVKYLEIRPYGLTVDSGPYLVVIRLPNNPLNESNVLWLRDMKTLNRIEKIYQKMPIILEQSFFERASVRNLEDAKGLSVAHELRRCGFLPPETNFAFSLTSNVTESVIVHENVHIADFLGTLSTFFKDLEGLSLKYKLDDDSVGDVRSYVMEERGYTAQLSFIKNKIKHKTDTKILAYSNFRILGEETPDIFELNALEEYDSEFEVAKKVFEDDYYPRIRSVMQKIKNNPELARRLESIVTTNTVAGPLALPELKRK